MNRWGQSAARTLVLLLAFAWPLGAFVYVPWVNVNLTPCAAAALVALWIADFLLTRRQRVPFELTWPALVLIVLAWLSPARERAPVQSLGLLTFLAVSHFAEGGSFSGRTLRLTAAAGGVLAMLALAGEAGEVVRSFIHFPTVQTPNLLGWMGWSLAPIVASPLDLVNTILILGVCLAAALEGRRRNQAEPETSIGIGEPLFFVALVVLAPWLLPQLVGVGLPELPAGGLLRCVIIAVTVWLFARVMAKAMVYRRERGEKTLVVALLLGLACVAHLTPPTAAFSVFLIPLGFIAGGTLPRIREEGKRLPLSPPIAIVLAMTVLNLSQVYPLNHLDPRNYEMKLRNDVASQRLDRAWQRLGFVLYWNPYEQRGRLWRARLALEFNRPYLAAHEFEVAVNPLMKTRQVLLPPTQGEIDAFLVRLRDYCSSLPQPERVFAYEKALIAAGRVDDAMALLGDKSETAPMMDEAVDMDTCLTAFVRLLDFPRDRESQLIAAVSEKRMPGMLAAAGAEILDRAETGLDPELDVNPTFVEFGVMEVSCASNTIEHMGADTPEVPDYDVPPVPARWQIDRSDPTRVRITLIASPSPGTSDTSTDTINQGPGYMVDLVVDLDQPLPDAPAILILGR